jgi:PAS domain-containing protein
MSSGGPGITARTFRRAYRVRTVFDAVAAYCACAAAAGAPRSTAISATKPIQLILARQLASSLAMPIIIVDTLGTLIYYNEPAEKLLAQRFEETGEMLAEKWGVDFDVQDEERRSIPKHEWPLVLALTQEKPVSRTIWLLSPDGIWRHLYWTSVPLVAQSGKFLGVQSVFWEA